MKIPIISGLEVIKRLKKAGNEHGLGIITEILGPMDMDMSLRDAIELYLKHGVGLFQVGARNAQNQELLKALKIANVQVVLKNGIGMRYNEFLGAANWLDANRTMLCVRGRSVDTDVARFGQEIVTIDKLVGLGKYPILFDPSHIAGKREHVYGITMGAVAMGVDGLLVEVHTDPIAAWTDGRQSVTPEQFRYMVKSARAIRHFYLEQRVLRKNFSSAEIPKHVDIYFEPKYSGRLEEILGDLNYKTHEPQKNIEVLTARIPAEKLETLRTKGIAIGKLFPYSDKDNDAAAMGIIITPPNGQEIHMSPYSEEVLRVTNRNLGSASKGRARVEFANGYPGDRVTDAYVTIMLGRVPQLAEIPLVIYKPVIEK